MKQTKYTSFNEFQLRLYANCLKFISVQGGNSTLASYFGGTNIILSKKGHELFFREYQTIYPRLSGAKIIQVNNDLELLTTAQSEFVNE